MKKFFWLLFALILILAVFLEVVHLTYSRTNMDNVKEAEVCFIYGNAKNSNYLSNKEIELLKDIFNKKKMYKDNLSCGFSEDISIKFNKSQTFCIARDTCPFVYWKEEDKYIKISEEEKIQLYNLLKSYGFFFPCV